MYELLLQVTKMPSDGTSWLLAAAITTVVAVVLQRNAKLGTLSDKPSSNDQRKKISKRMTVEHLVTTKLSYLEYIRALDLFKVHHTESQRTPEFYYGHHTKPRDWRESVQELRSRIGYLEEQVSQVSDDTKDSGCSSSDPHDSNHDTCIVEQHDMHSILQDTGLRPLVEHHYEDLARFCATSIEPTKD